MHARGGVGAARRLSAAPRGVRGPAPHWGGRCRARPRSLARCPRRWRAPGGAARRGRGAFRWTHARRRGRGGRVGTRVPRGSPDLSLFRDFSADPRKSGLCASPRGDFAVERAARGRRALPGARVRRERPRGAARGDARGRGPVLPGSGAAPRHGPGLGVAAGAGGELHPARANSYVSAAFPAPAPPSVFSKFPLPPWAGKE